MPQEKFPLLKRILLVDDHPKVPYELRLILEETGEYEVLIAQECDAALVLSRVSSRVMSVD